MVVYVLDMNGQPLMPTVRFGKVRRLLRDKKAKVVRSCPFTIRLLYEPETKIVQEIVLGVDTGSKHVGVACIGNDKVLYQAQVELRDDIKRKWILVGCIEEIDVLEKQDIESLGF